MAETLNSEKKINYAKEVGASLAVAKSNIQRTVSNLQSMCGNVRFATADRCYNEIAKIGSKTIEAINQYATGVANEVLTPLISGKGGMMRGQALVTKVKSVVPELESIASGTAELPLIPQATIDGRGLDENWTDTTRAAFGEECKAFIGIRSKLMAEIADITSKCSESDTKVVYHNLGNQFEKVCNESAAAYSALKDQLEEAAILLKATAETMENAYASIATDTIDRPKEILGQAMDCE